MLWRGSANQIVLHRGCGPLSIQASKQADIYKSCSSRPSDCRSVIVVVAAAATPPSPSPSYKRGFPNLHCVRDAKRPPDMRRRSLALARGLSLSFGVIRASEAEGGYCKGLCRATCSAVNMKAFQQQMQEPRDYGARHGKLRVGNMLVKLWSSSA